MMVAVGKKALPEGYNADPALHLGLVKSIARSMLWASEDLDDLISIGNIALCRAAQDFDPERGTQFSTVGTAYIKRAILTERRNRRLKCRDERRTVRLTDVALRYVGVRDEPGVMERDDAAKDDRRTLVRAMGAMTPRQAAILIGRAGGQTLGQVAADHGFTKEAARQEEAKGLAKARERLGISVETEGFTGSLRRAKCVERQVADQRRRRRERKRSAAMAGR